MKYYIFLLIVLFSSCYTKQAAIRKFCNQKVVTAVIDTNLNLTVPKPIDTSEFHTDSLALLKLLMAKADSLLCLYQDSLIEVQAMKVLVVDSSGNVKTVIKFKVIEKPGKEIKIKVPVRIPVAIPCNCPPPPDPTWKDHFKTGLAWSGGIFWLLLLVGLVLYFIFRKK